MKKLATLALTFAALALLATDAQAFGRRGCNGGRIFHRPCVQAAPCCQTTGTATVTSPTPAGQGEIRYFPQYQPAQAQPLPATTGSVAPVTTVNGCSNGTCHTTHGFGLFRRR